MKPVEFHPQATEELDAAVKFLETRLPGLGIDLRKEVEIAVGKIQSAPALWKPYSKRTRRFLVRRFPYLVIYRELSDTIFVVAVADGRRRPGYWHDRL